MPPAISHQPPAISYQPPATSYQPPATNHQPIEEFHLASSILNLFLKKDLIHKSNDLKIEGVIENKLICTFAANYF